MKDMDIVNGALVAVVTVALASAMVVAQSAPPSPATTARPINVTTVLARSLDRPLAVPGDLVAFQDVEIRAKVAGFVEAVNVDRGSTVRRGQLLARLVAPELGSQGSEAAARVQSAVSQRIEAEARLASDEASFQRLKAAATTPGVVAALCASTVAAADATVANAMNTAFTMSPSFMRSPHRRGATIRTRGGPDVVSSRKSPEG